MSMLHTALIGLGIAVVLGLPSLNRAEAQFLHGDREISDPFGGFSDPYAIPDLYSDDHGTDYAEEYQRSINRLYERRQRQRQILEEAMRPFQRDPLVEWLERDAEDRIHAREACDALTNNPAARIYCLQGLR